MLLDILFHDQYMVAIDKPAGLLVHRSRVDLRAREFALQMLRDQIGQTVYPVHRIDRPTSGVLLFALDKATARNLCDQFAARSVGKTYLAIVRGKTAASLHWDEPLVEKRDRMTDGQARKDKPAQSAITEFERRQTWTVPFSAGKYPRSRYSLVEAHPLTGRKHQLRRHFNHLAHPIVGDTTYGDRRHNRLFRDHLGIHGLMLMAQKMKLNHPVAQTPIEIEAPISDRFVAAIERLNQEHMAATEATR